MKKIATILFLCMIFDADFVNAQNISLKPATSKGLYKNIFPGTAGKNARNSPLLLIPTNFYSSHLGFFCKKELQIESSIKLPFKFRLGSVAYNDWMEGKPNTSFAFPR